MRARTLTLLVLWLVLPLAGCGDDEPAIPVFEARILSDQPRDGDIAFDPVNGFRITQGPSTVFFGFDELDPNVPEYRAFLDFPLDGSTGFDAVPANAVIVSATLDLFVNEVSFSSGAIPTLLDLVQYPLSGLTPGDYSSVPLEFRSLDFLPSDQGNYVSIDVTSLMVEAQRRGLADFQVRFLLDFVPNPSGFVGIEDQPRVLVTAPLLIVRYR